jgi:hypothetical protein
LRRGVGGGIGGGSKRPARKEYVVRRSGGKKWGKVGKRKENVGGNRTGISFKELPRCKGTRKGKEMSAAGQARKKGKRASVEKKAPWYI